MKGFSGNYLLSSLMNVFPVEFKVSVSSSNSVVFEPGGNCDFKKCVDYFVEDNVIIFSRFLNHCLLKKNTRVPDHMIGSVNVMLIPTDTVLLRNVLNVLTEYEYAGELALFLFQNKGLYIIPGDYIEISQSIIDHFEKGDRLKIEKNPYDPGVIFYSDDKKKEAMMRKFFDPLFSTDYFDYQHFVLSLCEMPVISSLLYSFTSNSDRENVTFGQWLYTNIGFLKEKDYISSFFCDSNTLINSIISIFIPRKSDFTPSMEGFSPNFRISHSPLQLLWTDNGYKIKYYLFSFNADNMRTLFDNNDKLYGVSKKMIKGNKNNTNIVAYLEYVNTFFDYISKNKINLLITPEQSIELSYQVKRSILSSMDNLKANNIITSKEYDSYSKEINKIILARASDTYFVQLSFILSYCEFGMLDDNNIYDFIIFNMIIKNPSSCFNNIGSGKIITLIKKAYDEWGNYRKITSLLCSLSIMVDKPVIGEKEWGDIVSMGDSVGMFSSGVPLVFSIRSIVGNGSVQSINMFDMSMIVHLFSLLNGLAAGSYISYYGHF